LNHKITMTNPINRISGKGVEIIEELNKGMLSIKFTLQYLNKFITDGKLTKEDLFNFYNAEDVKKKFSALSLELPE
jgi:hypothetical protein